MNIAFVVHHYDRAEGTGGYVTELLPRIARAHDVTLYAASARTPVPKGVRVVRVPAVRGPAYATILSFPYAFAAVRGAHDLVHAQGWVAPRADVVTAHIVLAAWRAAAGAAHVPPARGERLFGGFVTRREAALIRGARGVIAPSERARDDIQRHYGRTDGVHVIPHGFRAAPPLAAQTRQRFGFSTNAFVATYVGDARKGLIPALRAVANTPATQLLIVSHSTPAPYEAEAGRLGIRERIRWLGPQEDMAPVYAASDVLLHPTVYDTFGLVVAEAMSAGLPAIVGRAAGVCDLIDDRESGWIVDGPEEAAAALDALGSDATLRRALGAEARVTAEAYGWDVVADRTLALYEAVASQ